jgi:hypothetical protein
MPNAVQTGKRERMTSDSRTRTSRGFGNHNAQAAMLLTGMGVCLGIGPAIQLAQTGPAGAAGAAALGLVIAAGPFLLVRISQAGYMDNGCLSTLLLVGGYMGIAFLARRLEWPPEGKAAALLAGLALVPWVFYGSVWSAILVHDRRARKTEEDTKKPEG